jgi:hypothetical protein
MTLSGGLALLTRYVGMAFIPAGVLTIVFAPGQKLGKRVGRACIFAGLALVPIGLWLVYNLRVVGAWRGLEPHPQFMDPRGFLTLFAVNLASCASTITSWYLPVRGVWLSVLAAAVVAVALAAAAASRAARGRLADSAGAVLVHSSASILLFATYIFVVVSLVSAKHISFVVPRYLAHLYVPVTLILLEFGARLLRPPRLPSATLARAIPAMLLALWLCYPLAYVARSTVRRFKDGAGGLNTTKWRESGTVAYAKRVLPVSGEVRMYSNYPDALWFLAGVDAILTPEREKVSLSDLKGRWPAGNGALLVWFNTTSRPHLFSIEELKDISNIEEVARFSDGSIHRTSARGTAAHEPGHRFGEATEGAPPESLPRESR